MVEHVDRRTGAPFAAYFESEGSAMAGEIGRRIPRPEGFDGQTVSDVSTPAFEREYPALWKFLKEKRGSGQGSSTGCLVLFVEATAYKLCLNDRPNNRSAFVSGATFGLALSAAETGIAQGKVRWRKKGYKRPSPQQTMFA